MKGLDRCILIIFSLIVIALAVGMLFVSTDMISLSTIANVIQRYIFANKVIALVASAVFALLGLVGLFSRSDSEENVRGGLAIKGDNGTVYITRDTFENLIVGVTRNYTELKNVKVDMQVTEDGVVTNVYAMILPDTVVTTLTTKLQEDIKSCVLKQTTVEVKEINVKIKGVYQEPVKR